MEIIIDNALRSVGITRNYRGYKILTMAVKLVLEDETRLYRVTKDIYAPIAEMCGCKQHCVEKNIRSVILVAWNNEKEELVKMARYELSAPPTPAQFIDILASYVASNIK